jgi:hypothetical protein
MWHDSQLLFIGRDGCIGTESRPTPHGDDCPVSYEQIWTVNVADGEYLADRDGNFFYTSDDKRISFSDRSSSDGKVRLSMTGDEFLKKWEGRDPNGEIDTIPEMFDAARGISDDTTIKNEIEEEVAESDVERVTPEDLNHFVI